MKKIIKIIIILIFVFVGFNFLNNKTELKLKTPDARYNVIVADTAEKRTQGLSGREKLKDNEVMFFIFDKEDKHGIWMKDMLFNIDIVFLDENMEVINYYDDVSPSTYPAIFYPETNAKYVLEMNSGERIKSGLDKGIKVYYK